MQINSGGRVTITNDLYVSGNPVLLSGFVTGMGNVAVSYSGSYLQVSGRNFQSSSQITGTSASLVIDWSLASTFYRNLTGNSTVSFLNDQDGQSIVTVMRNSGVNNYSVSWPGTVKWPSGIAPTQSSGKHDVYTFIKIDTGVYGNVVQGFTH